MSSTSTPSRLTITEAERLFASQRTTSFLANPQFPYANLSNGTTSLGWVRNLHLHDSSEKSIGLNFRDEQDLFLLFVLAVVWSRTGPWENAVFFVAQLKACGKHEAAYWQSADRYRSEQRHRQQAALQAERLFRLPAGARRRSISYRQDIYPSLHLLANRWSDILTALAKAQRTDDFLSFIRYMRSIAGLGYGKKRLLIKIPLILRELRCQGIYPTIPGAYCCVPDVRVKRVAKELKIDLVAGGTLSAMLANSAKLYHLFGDLYDFPLFADLSNH